MRKIAALLVVMSVLAAPAAAKAEGFILGMIVGGSLFGGDTKSLSGGSVLYVADEETLKKADPAKLRLIAYDGCFGEDDNNGAQSLGEMFSFSMKRYKKDPTQYRILRAVRSYSSSSPARCAGIWFDYVDIQAFSASK